jgi:hypothetical protein
LISVGHGLFTSYRFIQISSSGELFSSPPVLDLPSPFFARQPELFPVDTLGVKVLNVHLKDLGEESDFPIPDPTNSTLNRRDYVARDIPA